MNLDSLLKELMLLAAHWGPKVLLAIGTLIIGSWIIGKIIDVFSKILDTRHVDKTLRPFLRTMVGFGLKILLFISVAEMVGIETTSFVAVLGAAGLAVGLALQGSLSNFAGGVLILIFRPFKIGDLVEAQGHLGFVKEISVLVTFLETFQNKTVIIPNGPLIGGNIVNYSMKGSIRADFKFQIPYEADIKKAKEIAIRVLEANEKVMKDPAPTVYVSDLADNGVEMIALPYCTVKDYWDVFWGLRQTIKEELEKKDIHIPYPQRVVHLKQEA